MQTISNILEKLDKPEKPKKLKTKDFVEVAVPLPLYQTFTYKIPSKLKDKIKVGNLILVPFGKIKITAYVLSFKEEADEGIKIKEVEGIVDETVFFTENLVKLFEWIAGYYLYPIGETIKTALPSGINIEDELYIALNPQKKETQLDKQEEEILKCLSEKFQPISKMKQKISPSRITKMKKKGLIITKRVLLSKRTGRKTEKFVRFLKEESIKLTPKQTQILNLLKQEEEVSISELNKKIPNASASLSKFLKKSFIEIAEKNVYRDPFGEVITPDTPKTLTTEQQKVKDTILNSLDNEFKSYLLDGVTGSGKTEVYMQIVAETLKKNKTALILVPEISLISQTEKRFMARFGKLVAVLHSKLSKGEKYDQWIRIVEKKAKVVIGARSAIFAPLENIGIIIVDEEHDTSYKQEVSLRYNARDMALMRGKIENVKVLLASATPSVQSYFNTKINKIERLCLKNRVNKKSLPEILIADLNEQKGMAGVKKFITPLLYNSIKETLENKKQVLLFLNRRGYENFPFCTLCNEPLKCKHCDVTLTLHKSINAYQCHLCGYIVSSKVECPNCLSPTIVSFGLGTEKIERGIKVLFPKARVARLDIDTTTKKDSMVKILKSVKKREVDILIGTQMISKGHDFPDITLVGIVCADISLNFPDFRANERTYQIIAQVAGRAGRGDTDGKVVMQTYNKEHSVIQLASKQNYSKFYEREILFRKSLNFPPFSKLILIRISGKNSKEAKIFSTELSSLLNEIKHTQKNFFQEVEILGPIKSPIEKIAKNYRWQILLKCNNVNTLQSFAKKVDVLLREKKKKDILYTIDVDPFFMM